MNAPDYSFTARGDASFTDNAYLTPANRTSSFIIVPGATLSAHDSGRRGSFDANIDVAYDFYTATSDLNGPRVKALLDGTFRITDDTLSLRGRAATSQQSSNQLGVVSITERTLGGNQVQVLTYGGGPAFRSPLSDSVVADASYDISGVSFLKAPVGSAAVAASDALLHNARAALSNNGATTPLRWTLTGTFQKQTLAGGAPASEREGGEASAKYLLSSTFAILATGGYEQVHEPTLRSRLTGGYGLGGIQIQPGPNTSLRLEAGYRYRHPNYSAELTYAHSEKLNLVAGYDQGVDTSQGYLNDAYARLVHDPAGNLIDPLTGLPPNAGNSIFDLTNQAFRFRRFRFGLHGSFGRSFYSAAGSYERRSADDVRGDGWQANASLGRNLSPYWTMLIEAQYRKTTSPALSPVLGPSAETISGTARTDYRLSPTLTASVSYSHLKHSTTFVDYRENTVMLSIRKQF
ncbi:MAG: TIGR03016 family PEP-CTERM system-associated outer membrane protein [Rhodospirillaceae bacterium]